MELETDVNRVLDLTIDHINKGWVKGHEVSYRVDDEGLEETVCIIGGIGLACEAIADTDEYALELEKAAQLRVTNTVVKAGHKSTASFNDYEGTSKDDVINLLKDAINNLQSKVDGSNN